MADISLLKGVALFKGVDEPDIEKVAEVISYRKYKAGDVIFKESEAGSQVYIILQGAVRLFREVRGDEEQTMAILKDGKFFGEMSLFGERKGHTATALVLRETNIAVLSKDSLNKLSEDNPRLAYIVLRQIALAVCTILRDMDQKMIDMVKYIWEFGAKT